MGGSIAPFTPRENSNREGKYMMETQEKTPPKFEHSAVASLARVWRFREHGTIYSEEYTLAMAKFVYVQVRGVEKPAKVAADEAKEELGGAASPPHRLKLLLGGKPVGEFKFDSIDGWWIEDWQP
jgi:hypothetical protein